MVLHEAHDKMTTPADLEAVLRGVLDAELGSDIVEPGMVRAIYLAGGIATVSIALTIAACPLRSQIEGDAMHKVRARAGIDDVMIHIAEMTPEQRSELMVTARRRAQQNAEPTMVNPQTRVIGVGSGKASVGKSSISVNLAAALKMAGFRVGLLDADMWGHSVPRMIGATGRLETGDDRKIIPAKVDGIQVASTGLLVDKEGKALMWRGLMLSKALSQFLTDVAWDQNLDYLVIDLPPGTGDIQMALARMLPQAQMLVVTTPQLAAQRVAARIAEMARRSHLPVIGVVENMDGFTTPDGTRHQIFGSGGGTDLAGELGVGLVGSIPIDPGVASTSNGGTPVVVAEPATPAARAFAAMAHRLVEMVPPAPGETCTARLAVLMHQMTQSEMANLDELGGRAGSAVSGRASP